MIFNRWNDGLPVFFSKKTHQNSIFVNSKKNINQNLIPIKIIKEIVSCWQFKHNLLKKSLVKIVEYINELA